MIESDANYYNIQFDKINNKHNEEGQAIGEFNHQTRLLKVERFFHDHKSKIKYLQLIMLVLFLVLTIVPLFTTRPSASDTIFS
ncbi:hypothetical protein BGC07_14945 [Piscirickettsia litoralis]|uniref:Uncharacterized protein n=1 Tax=Piscirickettsia litoralis TaxID=1891921 RepID=A0ABX3A941_9GAMM|nr:hypothetical protein BGC07_14945 [Piscirickettsia litoralis]